MSARLVAVIWLAILALFVLGVLLFEAILLPFVAGIAVAYLLDPIADRLERLRLSRTAATILVLLAFFLAGLATIILIVPVLHSQVLALTSRIPAFAELMRESILPALQELSDRAGIDIAERVRAAAADFAKDAANFIVQISKGALSGGIAFFNAATLLLITPIVAFYLLRDFDHMVAKIKQWLPRHHAATIRDVLHDIDRVLAGFVRGQGTVCLILGAFYAVGLSLLGLDFGLVIGFVSGLLSFIPFVGTVIGLLLSMLTALTQFLPDDDIMRIGLVAALFIAGQVLEANFLTPRLLGDNIGLHPVWVIFALLAGGSLAGFVGVLLAMPVAAVIGVMVRFGIDRYLQSELYLGDVPAGEGSATGDAETREGDAA